MKCATRSSNYIISSSTTWPVGEAASVEAGGRGIRYLGQVGVACGQGSACDNN
jgi:hypothetical protein